MNVVRDSVANSLPGERRDAVNVLKGIGPIPVLSLSTITMVCEVSKIKLEIILFVVLERQIPNDILIGMDLMKMPGLKVEISNDGTSISRVPEHNVFHIEQNGF